MDFTLGRDTVLLAATAREMFERDGVLRGVLEGTGSRERLPSRTRLLAEAGLNVLLVAEPLGIGCELLDATVVLEEAGRCLLPDSLAETIVIADMLAAQSERPELAGAILSGEIEVAADLFTRPTAHARRLDVRIRVPWVGDPTLLALLVDSHDTERGALMFFDVNAPEVRLGDLDDTDPTRPVRAVALDSAVPTTVVVLTRDQAARARRQTSILRASELVGGVAAVLETTLQYVRERRQFGREIGSYQAVKHDLADIYASVEQARASVQMAAINSDAGTDRAARDAAAAAQWVAAAAMRSVGTALHLHGGMGFSWETGLHLHLRRALALRRLIDAVTEPGIALSLSSDRLEATL